MSKKKEKAPKPEAGAEGAGGAEGAPAKKKLPMILIIGGLVGVLVLGGGGGAVYFLVLKPKPNAVAEAGKAAPKKDAKKDDKKGEAAAKAPGPNDPVIAEGPNGVVYYTPPAFMVNMQSPSPGSKAPLLQLKVTFEVADQDTADAMNAELPRLNGMMGGFLSELRSEDVDGSQGRVQLQLEILRRANLVVAPEKINAVNIVTMLVS
ncbi:MAG: flagellar basal body protein FliL [Caulobacteraceae bacterium]|nr:flagellar basal body protein FliL [Caulobacteraceae bacterium]